MKKTYRQLTVLLSLFIFFLFTNGIANAGLIKGIYITQSIFEDSKYLNYLIARSKKAGIDTFIVDMERPSKVYQNNLASLKENNIHYVARIVVFPDGGKPEQILSEAYWEKKYKLAQTAINYGAQQIQLDYIRYNTNQGASTKHSQDIHNIIKWFKEKLAKQSIPLQIDVFGIASFGEEKHIGQNIHLFSQSVDVICPMVYPSHYEPFREHAIAPYKTVYSSLESIKAMFGNKPLPFKLVPYIELSNYRYPLSQAKKIEYIKAQIKAVEASGVDGWYAWSPHNLYDNLFKVLETSQIK